jgi:stress response protein YsnF
MDDSKKISLASEELAIVKRLVEGETARVRIETKSDDHVVSLTAAHEHIEVETVEIGREINEMPEVRFEGNVTIVPVVEEQAVIVKRLILKQEVRLTRVRTEETVNETVALRSERAVIERLPPSIPNPSETPRD